MTLRIIVIHLLLFVAGLAYGQDTVHVAPASVWIQPGYGQFSSRGNISGLNISLGAFMEQSGSFLKYKMELHEQTTNIVASPVEKYFNAAAMLGGITKEKPIRFYGGIGIGLMGGVRRGVKKYSDELFGAEIYGRRKFILPTVSAETGLMLRISKPVYLAASAFADVTLYRPIYGANLSVVIRVVHYKMKGDW